MLLVSALLSLLAALVVRPDWPEAGPFGPLAEVPWWVTGAALASGALFVYALLRASRAVGWLGILPLLLAAGAAGRSASVGEAADTAADAAAAATLLAAGLACLTAAILAVGLSMVRSGWTAARSALATSRSLGTPHGKVVTAVVLSGVLLGGLLGATAGPGGEHLHEASREEPQSPIDTVHATSEPVDDVFARETPAGGESWDSEDGVTADTLSWRETVDGPVELTECVAEPTSVEEHVGYRWSTSELAFVPEDDEQHPTAYSTLIALDGFGGDHDPHDAEQSVLGLDPATGEEMWRYTVHADQPRRIGQVAVGAECDVLVVIDPGFLVALSALTGEVRDTVVLPSPLYHEFEPSSRGDAFDGERQRWELEMAVEHDDLWRFPPTTNQGQEPADIVRLSSSEVAVLTADDRLMTVRRHNAEILSFDELHQAYRCQYLADYDREPVVLRYGCGPPTVYWLGTGLTGDATMDRSGEHLGLDAQDWDGATDLEGVLGAMSVTVPDLGCWDAGRVPWSDGVDFSWIQLDLGVVLSGGCVWENIGPNDGPDPPEDAGDRVVRIAGPDARSADDTRTEPRPDALATGPTPVFHGREEPFVVFHVHDGTAYAREASYLSVVDSFRDPEGEAIVAVAQPHTRSLRSWQTDPVAAVTEEGSVVFHQRSTAIEYTGRTDAAREPCDGDRDLRVDGESETVLVLCTSDDSGGDGLRTEITALTEGDGDQAE